MAATYAFPLASARTSGPLPCPRKVEYTTVLDRYAQRNGDFVLVVCWLQAAFSPTAWMSLSRSSTTRW
jgi:hypothetical protein